MDSKIASSIKLKHNPVALIWSDEKPDKAIQFKEKKWGCIMWLLSSAAKGKIAVCDKNTFGCFGGGVGLGFGNQYKNFPGGEECFCYFLSCGNEKWEKGRKFARQIKPFAPEETYEDFTQGERYIKTPEQTQKFIRDLPIIDIPAKCVIFKPLKDVSISVEKPEVIVFFVNPDQLSALVVLSNYNRDSNDNTIIPYAAGCQTIGIYPYKEARSEHQRAVIGLTDLSARVHIKKRLGNNLMSFTVPFKMFEEMEKDIEGSFFERHTWQELMNENK